MKIFKELTHHYQQKPLSLSIGMFDGVHLGHQNIIKKLNEIAKQNNLESALLTFWPHPRLVFDPNDDLKLLNSIDEKIELLAHFGVQNLFLKEFDNDFRNLTGEEFVREILVKKLNVKYLMVGYDHTFGKNKSGNYTLLQEMAEECGFEVEEMNAFRLNHTIISSTKIRNALEKGNIIETNSMLGYFFSVSGKVIHGKKIGRTIGFPTANLEVDKNKILPKKGAYITEVFIDGKQYKGMTSVGTNPTVNGTSLTVETYILDFDQDIYGKNITLKFREFLHEEIKFESVEKLIERLEEDKRLTKTFNY